MSAWNSNSVQLIVGFSKVSASNIVAEIIRPALSAVLGVSVRIVTVPGENGAHAAGQTARAAPDGRTLCMAVPTHVLGALFEEKPRYDLLRDFAPVAMIARNPLVLAVSKHLGVDSIPALIALARSRPGELTYGASAVGGGPHLAALLFCAMAGVRMTLRVYAETHVLYEDLQAARIALTFNNTMSALPLAALGKLMLLGSTSPVRDTATLGIPAIAEAALPGYAYESWVGVLAPKGTPAPSLQHLNEAMQRVVQQAKIKQQLMNLGMTPTPDASESFADHLRNEQARWRSFVQAHIAEFPGVRRNNG